MCNKIYHFMKWNDFVEFIIAVSSDKYAVIFWSWSMYYIKMFFPSGWIECVLVQFHPWIKFYFLLFQTHYHTLPYTVNNKRNVFILGYVTFSLGCYMVCCSIASLAVGYIYLSCSHLYSFASYDHPYALKIKSQSL